MLKILLLRGLDPHALQLVDEVLLHCSDQVFCYPLRYRSSILVFLGLVCLFEAGYGILEQTYFIMEGEEHRLSDFPG